MLANNYAQKRRFQPVSERGSRLKQKRFNAPGFYRQVAGSSPGLGSRVPVFLPGNHSEAKTTPTAASTKTRISNLGGQQAILFFLVFGRSRHLRLATEKGGT